MAKRWYSVSVLSNFEKKVAEQIKTAVVEAGLQEEIDEVLVPTEEVLEVRRGKKVTSERRFMPGYVLVRMEMSSRGYHLISQINRVTGFLGPQGKPMPMRDAEVIAAAERAFHQQGLPLASVEGFIRQVLGWREFIRGVYWLDMPHLAEANHYGHTRDLPKWYWTGQTHMACMQATIGQSLQHGYAHHIQRLMVTGQFAVLAGLSPQQVSAWYRAMYVDAVEWVEMPNTLGMALHANGGRFTSKPYVASGQYIARMSNYCKGCRYDPAVSTGDTACPFTTLYWDYLDRHADMLAKNPRMLMQLKNLNRLTPAQREAIGTQAQSLRANKKAHQA